MPEAVGGAMVSTAALNVGEISEITH